MKTKITFHILIVFLLLTARELEARATSAWSYQELSDASDVVVIAKPLSNTDTKDVFDENAGYMGINTDFEAEVIIKGDAGIKKFTVLHFKHKPNVGWADGMEVIIFRLEGLNIDGKIGTHDMSKESTATKMQLPPPEYLLFLKKRSDGRYEPATGQMDARMSVKEVSDPFSELGI